MKMVENYHNALVIVTHNLGIVARHAQRINVMYAGRIVEFGSTDRIFTNPSKKQTQDYITGRFG